MQVLWEPRMGGADGVQRILFIRTDRIGDVLMNLPAVRRLRQNYPKAWITWMLDRSVAPLLHDHPDIDEIYQVDGAKLAEDPSYRRRVVSDVARARFSIGVASNAEKFFHWMLFRAGVPVRAGWRRKWSFLLNRTLPDDKARAKRHETDSNLALAGLVAPKPWDGSMRLPVDASAQAGVERRLSKEFPELELPVVAVHAGTSNPAKRWPLQHFTAVCRRLIERGLARVVLVGGSEEEAQSRELAARLPEGARDWTGALDLKQLSALLNSPRVKTLVSSDSGPVHVAWMHGKPVVALFAKGEPGSDPARWGPKSPRSVAIHKPIGEISPDEVFAAVEGILK